MYRSVLELFSIGIIVAFGQGANYPYVLRTFAGSFPLGDGGAATSALLYTPSAVALDGSGNIFILDSNNFRIRKVALDGTISTAVQLNVFGNDLKIGRDGSFYVSSPGLITKRSPNGTPRSLRDSAASNTR